MAYRKPIDGFLSNFFWVQHCTCLHIRDNWDMWPTSTTVQTFKVIQGQRS